MGGKVASGHTLPSKPMPRTRPDRTCLVKGETAKRRYAPLTRQVLSGALLGKGFRERYAQRAKEQS